LRLRLRLKPGLRLKLRLRLKPRLGLRLKLRLRLKPRLRLSCSPLLLKEGRPRRPTLSRYRKLGAAGVVLESYR